MLKLGIIGTGKIARIHVRHAKEIHGVEVVAVSSHERERAAEFANEFGISKSYGSYEEILNDDIDSVLICTTAPSHEDLILKSAKAGKYIFCEKPIGYDLKKIDEAIEEVKKANVSLFVGFNRRFDPHFKGAREAIERGDIGKPEIVRVTSRDPKAPSAENVTAEGALFLETMIHDLDMARYLAMDDVESIYVVADALVNPDFKKSGNVDTAIATLRFKGGAVGTIDNSWRATYGYDQRAEVLGSKGMYSVENVVNPEDKGKEGIHGTLPLAFFPERYDESYMNELKEFVACVKEGKQPPVTPEDAKKATVLALAAIESYKTKTPVTISF